MRVFAAGLVLLGSAFGQAPTDGDTKAVAHGHIGTITALLDNLAKELDAEFVKEQAAYDKQAVAYEGEITQLRKDIKHSNAEILRLTAAIEQNVADVATLETTITELQDDIDRKQKELKAAIAAREEEHLSYADQVSELEASISSANSAYQVLLAAQENQLTETRGSLLQAAGKKSEVEIFQQVKKSIMLLSTSKISQADLENLSEKMDDMIRKAQKGQPVEKAFLQFGPGSSRILGILKDMRGQFIATLQSAQEAEQEAATAHAAYVASTRQMIKNLENTKAQRQDQLAATKAEEAQNRSLKADEESALKNAEELLLKTVDDSKALAKAWGETSRQHTAEMNGLDKAVEVLNSGVAATSFLQVAAPEEKKEKLKIEDQNHGNRFWLIVKAIKDMIQTHQEEKAFNQDQFNTCEKTVLEGASQAAAKSAHIDQLKGKIAAANSEKSKREASKTEKSTEKTETETELATAQKNWEDSDAARGKEIGEMETLQEHVGKAITFLQDSDSGRDAFANAIGVLQMVLGEIVKETDALIKTKAAESAAFVDRKGELLKLIGTLEKTIAELSRDINMLGQKITTLETKLAKVEAQEPLPVDECKKFMTEFQGLQDALNTKMDDLTKAQVQLEGWENQATE